VIDCDSSRAGKLSDRACCTLQPAGTHTGRAGPRNRGAALGSLPPVRVPTSRAGGAPCGLDGAVSAAAAASCRAAA
jgi:hypothetical protein